MKKMILATFILLGLGVTSFAQCEKNQILKSSKTEFLNEDGSIKQTIDENTTVEINKSTITIMPGDDHTMIGDIKSVTCAWKTPYKEGKSVIKATFTDDGETKNITITIEGKDGKISLLATFDESPEKRIRVWADSFEEKK